MHEILGSERILYNRCIWEAKLNVDDFEITVERDAPGTKGKSSKGYTGTSTVTVTYKPTGITHHYRGGVIPWPYVKFERELNLNEYHTR